MRGARAINFILRMQRYGDINVSNSRWFPPFHVRMLAMLPPIIRSFLELIFLFLSATISKLSCFPILHEDQVDDENTALTTTMCPPLTSSCGRERGCGRGDCQISGREDRFCGYCYTQGHLEEKFGVNMACLIWPNKHPPLLLLCQCLHLTLHVIHGLNP